MRVSLRARARWTGLGVVIGVLVEGLAAQTQQSPSRAPQFRGTTTVVPLDVRVLDKQGKPVTDLTAADFTIVEDGVRQEIRHFSLQTLVPDASAVAAPLVHRTSQTVDLAPRSRRVFLIYVGRGYVQGPAQGLDGIVHLVRDLLLPQDLLAILAWNRATDFTTNRAPALALLDRVKQSYQKIERELDEYFKTPAYYYGNHQIPDWIQRDIDAVFVGPDARPMRTVNAQLGLSAEQDQRVRDAYDAYKAGESDRFRKLLVDNLGVDLPTFFSDTAETFQDEGNLYAGIEYLRHIDGEKHLVWLTEYGVRRRPWDPDELDRDLARVAADGRVVLNVIRAGGTEYSHGVLGGDVPGAGEARRASAITGVRATDLLRPAASSRTFAEITGGRSDANKFPSASVSADYIDQASRKQYLLGYYPTNAEWDSRFRNVTVTVNRRDVTVLVRRGYYGRNDVGTLDRQGVVTFSRIATAAGDPREVPDMSLRASARATPDGHGASLSITIDVSRVGFTKANDLNNAKLEIAVFCLDKGQRSVGEIRQSIELAYSDDRLAEARRAGVPVSLTVPVKAAVDSIKLVAYDYTADLTGSLNLRISR